MASKKTAQTKVKKIEESSSEEEVTVKPDKNPKGTKGYRGKSKDKEESKAEPMKNSKKSMKKKESDSSSEGEMANFPPPKRGLSAYLYFSQENRAKVVANNQDAPPKEIMRLLSAAWKKCGSSDKKRFEEMAAKDKVRYERQKQEYEDTGRYYDDNGNLAKPEIKKRKSSKKKTEKPMKRKSYN